VLKNFAGGVDGGYPLGALLVSGTNLYGTAQVGGLGLNGGGGTIFRLNMDGNGFQVIHGFTYGSDAFWPETGLVQSGTTLYGTTEVSSPNDGTVFRLNTDGSGYQLLKSFGASDGANPRGELLLSGSVLYGITSGHVYPGSGTVFKLNTNGSGFTVLKELSLGGDMYRLFSPLVMSGGILYGTACQDNYYGAVFKINPDGTGFAVLQTITNVNGAWEWPGIAGPVLDGTTLYATSGGRPNYPLPRTNNCGTVFQVNTDGSGYSLLKTFNFTDGANPGSSLLFSDGTLYGTTSYGGVSNNGVVFAIGLSPELLDSPKSQTAEEGSPVRLTARFRGSQLLSCQWFCNGAPIANTGTNSSLAWVAVQVSQAGPYVAILTNLFGAVTSSPAMLSVIPPVPRKTIPALRLTGNAGSRIHVTCADTPGPGAYWWEVASLSLTPTQQFYPDRADPLPPSRFYRAWQANVPSAPSALEMMLATELTLTGAMGSNVRVDCINQFGPTDAWVTLDTVTLTNATQPCFDYTMFRQPTRLYRLVPVP
jgi:uncharacterized repeat protein (TIGR03803 family)